MYFFRTITIASDHISRLENIIRNSFIPSLTGRSSISDLERDWLALLNRNSWFGLVYPQKFSKQQNQASRAITQPLVQGLRNRCKDLSYEVWESQERLV